MNVGSRGLKWLGVVVAVLAIGGCFAWLCTPAAAEAAPPLRYGLRVAIIACGLVGWFLSQSLIGGRPLRDGAMTDGVHELSAGLHGYLTAHPRAANAVLIVSSALIDVLGLALIAVSVLGPSVRPFIALLLLFIMRQVCQACCALPAPPGMIWRNPGFPSLLVTYQVANDFFFSGHTAIAVLAAIEAATLFPWWVSAAVAVVAVGEAAVVLILRAHYTMDVFTAVVAAFCAAGLADRLCTLA